MNLIALVGSLRKASYNRAVFESYREIARDRAEIVEGKFDTFPLYDEDIQLSAFPDAVSLLGEQIARADGVMFFSPEYNYSVPGALKNAIDWVSRIKSQPFARKPSTVIGASPGRLGTARMQYHLRQIGVFLDLDFMNRPEVMISGVSQLVGPDGRLTDAKTLEVLEGHFRSFSSFVAQARR